MFNFFKKSVKKSARLFILGFGFLSLSSIVTPSISHAYLSLNETGELLREGDFRLGAIPQAYLSDGGGTNVAAFMDFNVSQSVNSRLLIGGGSTDFWAQASAKWIPFPDYQNQPAMGLRGALIYARDNKLNFYNIQVTPIISKVTDSAYGKMIPYIGLPITVIYSDNRSITAMQFAVGNEWVVNQDFQVGAELDLNLSNTTTAISLHLNFPFDGRIGYRK